MISKDKQYRTRDGREVRIYATDGDLPNNIHGAVKNPCGWVPVTWNEYGISTGRPNPQVFDLIEIRPRIKREYWVNVYEEHDTLPVLHRTKEKAEFYRQTDLTCKGCVKVFIDCEEGEGL